MHSRKPNAIRAVTNPCSVEHLHLRAGPQGISVSIFVQTPRTNQSAYSLLIKCNRIGATLQIEDAFYLFHDTFKVPDAKATEAFDCVPGEVWYSNNELAITSAIPSRGRCFATLKTESSLERMNGATIG